MSALEKAARAVDPMAFDLSNPRSSTALRREAAFETARAVLMAVREPGEATVEKGMPHFADPCWPEDAAKGFTAIIDAMLAD